MIKKENWHSKKWDFEPESGEAKVILKELEQFIKKAYGRRCKAMAMRCPCCEMWTLYDLLKVKLW